jgi:hypothetical protein
MKDGVDRPIDHPAPRTVASGFGEPCQDPIAQPLFGD